MKKACFWQAFSLLMQFHCFQLVLNDCFVRASAGASAATNASVRVDDVDVAFRDSAHRAFVNASAASNAGISDFVSHSVFNFKLV